MQPEARLLSRREVLQYCGYSDMKSLEKLIDSGIIPGPLPGTNRFDRRALDAALDRASALREPQSAG
ncbi:putative DNA-binding transcriptional regulator AlpA [Bradyrhizobium elkanii]|nr:putative DNA-binding transcriptional regulator AlpA [Bradyrhizobium elkanii]